MVMKCTSKVNKQNDTTESWMKMDERWTRSPNAILAKMVSLPSTFKPSTEWEHTREEEHRVQTHLVLTERSSPSEFVLPSGHLTEQPAVQWTHTQQLHLLVNMSPWQRRHLHLLTGLLHGSSSCRSKKSTQHYYMYSGLVRRLFGQITP